MIGAAGFAITVLIALLVIIVNHRRESRRVESLAELAGLRRLPRESNESLRDRTARRFGAGLGVTVGGRK